MELVVQRDSTPDFELDDDDFGLFRAFSERTAHATRREPWAQMEATPHEDASDTESQPGEPDLQQDVLEVPINDGCTGREGAKTRCVNHDSPTHPSTCCCRKSYLLDATSTCASSDESVRSEQSRSVLTAPVPRIAPAESGESIAVKSAGDLPGSGTEPIAMPIPAMALPPLTICPSGFTPLILMRVSGSSAAPNVVGCSTTEHLSRPSKVPDVQPDCGSSSATSAECHVEAATKRLRVRNQRMIFGLGLPHAADQTISPVSVAPTMPCICSGFTASGERAATCYPTPSARNTRFSKDIEGAWLSQQSHIKQKISRAVSELSFGHQHRFHEETHLTGRLSNCARLFTKMRYEGRLSIITENRVHSSGLSQYVVQFTAGEMSSADGVGFIFSSTLPSTKNIQRIVSVFANKEGQVCFRAGAEIVRSRWRLQPLQLGDWIAVSVDLTKQVAYFRTVCTADGKQSSQVSFAFGDILERVTRTNGFVPQSPQGYLACVVKNLGVTVQLWS